MGAGDIGLATADFSDNALSDFPSTVSWENATKSTDLITGEETISYAAGTNKTVVFVKRAQRYVQGREGLVDLGDAICLAPTTFGFAKNDRLTFQGEKFIIDRVIRRRADDSVTFFDSCVCIKMED